MSLTMLKLETLTSFESCVEFIDEFYLDSN